MPTNLAKLDETKRDDYLAEYRERDEAGDLPTDWEFIDSEEIRTMIDELANTGYLVPVDPKHGFSVYLDTDSEDAYANLQLWYTTNPYWPSVNGSSEKIRYWFGKDEADRENLTWTKIAENVAWITVERTNELHGLTMRMAREFAVSFPEA